MNSGSVFAFNIFMLYSLCFTQALNEYRISGDYVKNYQNAVGTIARCSRSSEMFVSMSTVNVLFGFNIVRFTMYFCSEFMKICKPIHFWKAYNARSPSVRF